MGSSNNPVGPFNRSRTSSRRSFVASTCWIGAGHLSGLLANAAVRLLDDPGLAAKLASAGRRFVEERFGDDRPVEVTIRAHMAALA
jgi:hypothetical protein